MLQWSGRSTGRGARSRNRNILPQWGGSDPRLLRPAGEAQTLLSLLAGAPYPLTHFLNTEDNFQILFRGNYTDTVSGVREMVQVRQVARHPRTPPPTLLLPSQLCVLGTSRGAAVRPAL